LDIRAPQPTHEGEQANHVITKINMTRISQY
jgi:hypothetical protein